MKINKEVLMNILMLVGFLMLLFGASVFSWEILSARDYCKSVDGNYSLVFEKNNLINTCNDHYLSKYDGKWGFYHNFSMISVELPPKYITD